MRSPQTSPLTDRDAVRAGTHSNLPTSAEHEHAFCRLSKQFEDVTMELLDGVRATSERADPATVAAKFADLALKARRSALECALQRDKDEQIKRMERTLRDMQELKRAH